MADDTILVPDDHEVTVFSMAVEPGVRVTDGNAIIANFGVAGDDGDRELDDVLAAVDKAVAARAEATVVDVSGPLLLSSLFAPNMPKTTTVRSPITWVMHDGNVVAIMASERRRAALITFMQRMALEGVPQAVYFIEPPDPAVAVFAQHMIGLGVVMRQPDANDGELLVQLEIKHPDGVYTVLAGAAIPVEGLPRSIAPRSLVPLPPQVLKMRVEKLEITDKPFAFRSPRLREEILAPPQDLTAFVHELLARDLPLFVLRKPDSEAIDVRNFGETRALPVYADVICMHWAAADLGLARDAYVPGPADLRRLLEHAGKDGIGLAIGTYRDRESPEYCVLPAELVARVAGRA
jgi:hypothetical protein